MSIPLFIGNIQLPYFSIDNDTYALVNTKNEQIKAVESERDSLSDYMADISHQLKTPITSMTVSYTHLDVYKRQHL